jgi:hypothetical protein
MACKRSKWLKVAANCHKRLCAGHRRSSSYTGQPGEVYIEGRCPSETAGGMRWVPFAGCYCTDHEEFTCRIPADPDKLSRKYTAFDTMDKLTRSGERTLRPEVYLDQKEYPRLYDRQKYDEMTLLRAIYRGERRKLGR